MFQHHFYFLLVEPRRVQEKRLTLYFNCVQNEKKRSSEIIDMVLNWMQERHSENC